MIRILAHLTLFFIIGLNCSVPDKRYIAWYTKAGITRTKTSRSTFPKGWWQTIYPVPCHIEFKAIHHCPSEHGGHGQDQLLFPAAYKKPENIGNLCSENSVYWPAQLWSHDKVPLHTAWLGITTRIKYACQISGIRQRKTLTEQCSIRVSVGCGGRN